MSVDPNGDEDQLVECECGHEVPMTKSVVVPEIRLCEECYTPFDATKWPTPIGKWEHRVRERHGSSKVTNTEYLLGLDRRGRAVYFDGENSRIKTYVPMHDTAYKEDRAERAEEVEERYTPEKGQGVLRPKRKTMASAGPGLSGPDDFVTLPNGDHIVLVDVSDKMSMFDLEDWVEQNATEWQQMNPGVVERFCMGHTFGTESGKPLVTKVCLDCKYSEKGDPKALDYHCPECDSHKFRERRSPGE